MNRIIDQEYSAFVSQLKQRIVASQQKALLYVNRELVLLYHQIGILILQMQKKKGWGAKVIDQISLDLRAAFPAMKGFSTRNLKYMRKFAENYHDIAFVQEVLAQLPWYHNITLLDKITDPSIRLFYIEHAIKNGWSRSLLVAQIETQLHNR